ncbi:acyl transferase/acyl hydrolase/lysophospholipase [Jimgerdemannia flammicorona]|uniref:Acyl transferase/acyl hydrolase/lysophospholipase n=1 Tax=Jimgerdemannia flammicorona TaxID=994334 RepID=A0A433D164_9FUNG|nr:acyl transferase/acyl hydrolase/lysophospholipase [Jimgerdemannia flammicorona]
MPMRRPNMASNRSPQFLRAQGRKNTMGSINSLNSINTLNSIKGQIEKYYPSLRVPTFGGLLTSRKNDGPSGLQNAASNDFARLARRLCGKSVALVLGGGGARGIGHIGVIRCMEEAGIPIDIIGGTSIGSFVGGLYARDADNVAVYGRAKMFSGRVTSVWRQALDLTYPITAWFTGMCQESSRGRWISSLHAQRVVQHRHEFNRGIWKCFMDSQIEDFWLPYFAVTTNITFSRMEVHTKGYAWRYVRASMSLSGYLPPICENGDMLVDGGYMDNLPVSVAKNMGADMIVAVDVASHDDTSPVYYGDSVSGWWSLMQSFNPFWKPNYKIPSIADIQSRLAYVSSVAKLEEAKVTKGCIYMKLPVQKWATLEFDKFDDILKAGYDHAKDIMSKWKKEGITLGRLNQIADGMDPITEAQGGLKGRIGRRNSI